MWLGVLVYLSWAFLCLLHRNSTEAVMEAALNHTTGYRHSGIHNRHCLRKEKVMPLFPLDIKTSFSSEMTIYLESKWLLF